MLYAGPLRKLAAFRATFQFAGYNAIERDFVKRLRLR